MLAEIGQPRFARGKRAPVLRMHFKTPDRPAGPGVDHEGVGLAWSGEIGLGGYMIFYSLGSALGSIVSTMTYGAWGWTDVCLLGAGIGLVAQAFWAATLKVGR